MKRTLYTLCFLMIGLGANAQAVFINEIHYDNFGTDTGEGVEIAGPSGTDLSTYELYFYNGFNGTVYSTLALSGSLIDMSGCGYGVLWFDQLGIQNGAPDGVALVENGTTVIQFLSYEGTLLATDGPALGMTATDIGVLQDGTLTGMSLQLTGTGTVYTDFTWAPDATSTYDAINNSQNFCGVASPEITFASASSANAESAGTVAVTLNINPAPAGAETVDLTITDNTTNYGVDYTTTPAGAVPFTLNVGAGVTSVTFDVTITDDVITETAEDFTVSISGVSAGLTIGGISSHVFTINDNDTPATPIAQVQATTGGDYSDMEGNTVTVGGRVSAVAGNGFYIQDNPGAWNGIYVYDNGANTVSRGDSVIVSGTVTEFAPGASTEKVTQIASLTSFSNEGNFTPHPNSLVSTSAANDEMYESVLISVQGASTTAGFNGFNEYVVNDGSGSVLIDDFLYLTTPAPVVNDLYDITGVVSHNFAAYKILPRDAADVVLVSGASVAELNAEQTAVYPNPSNGTVHVKNPLNEKVAVYNTLGEVVMNPSDNKFNLKNGVYLIRIGSKTTRLVVL